MKRFLALLLTVMLALSLCIMVFADTDSYEDEPVQETQTVVESEEETPAPEVETASDDGIAVYRSECARCGEMSVVSVRSGAHVEGPEEVECIHYHFGVDLIYRRYVEYQEHCGSCGYVSPEWSVYVGDSPRECHGY